MGRGLRIGGADVPAWRSAAVGEWAQISGTTAPINLKDFSGLAVVDDGSTTYRLVSAAPGGHSGNGTDNAVDNIELAADVPAGWVQLRAGDDPTGWDTTGESGAYFPLNGKPAPRHTYTDIHHVPEHGRIWVGGSGWGSSAANAGNVADGFRLSDNDWDAAGTYGARPNRGPYLEARDPATGVRYSTTGYKWTPGASPAASAFSAFTLSGTGTTGDMGSAWDSTRGRIYHLSVGTNFSSASSPINSCRIDPSTGVKTDIGFSASQAWTDFQTYAAASAFLTSTLDYDPDDDCFYFYNGSAVEGTQTVWRIRPGVTDTWTMDYLPAAGGTPGVSLNATNRGGVNSKFRYVSRWRTLLLAVPGESIWYLRTA